MAPLWDENADPAGLGEWVALDVVDDELELGKTVGSCDVLVGLVPTAVEAVKGFPEVL